MTEWTQDQAMAELDPFLEAIDAIARGGLATYREYPPQILIDHDARTTANCIYSHMVGLADELLTDQPGVIFKNIKGLKVWILGERATIRFKKMDQDGRYRNYQTEQAREFDRQLALPGIPHPPLNLVVGYLPDPSGTEVERVQVARPMGKSIDWCAAIVPAEELEVGKQRWIDVTRQARAI